MLQQHVQNIFVQVDSLQGLVEGVIYIIIVDRGGEWKNWEWHRTVEA